MSVKNFLKSTYLSYFSKPVADRPIYRAIRRYRPASILEVGIGAGVRAMRMLDLAQALTPDGPLSYVGIDRFEDRTAADVPGMSLKMAYRLLSGTNARIQLVPGEVFEALARLANTLQRTDLIVISAQADADSLARAWFYLPRILHPESLVFLEKLLPTGEASMRLLSTSEIERLVAAASRRRAA